ncbi:MAG: acyltransferase [Candidatus Melainabacteria bacterium]
MVQSFPDDTPLYFENHQDDTAHIHATSVVERPSRIGRNTRILHFSCVMPHAIIGDNCHIGHHVTIASGVMVANAVHVSDNALLNTGVILEDGVYCGASTVFTEEHRVRHNRGVSPVTPTLVRRGAHIGANTTIASGATIGRYAFVEAGTVIDRNIPDFAVVYGNPLTLNGWQCQCGQPLVFSGRTGIAECEACGQRYQQQLEWKIIPVDAQTDAGVSRLTQEANRRDSDP